MFRIKLKELRENSGYSQQSFADAFGVAQSTVGGWEAGKREPNFRTTLKIASFFHVSVDYLLGTEPEKVPTQKGEHNMNTITIAGRDGSRSVRQLTDDQLQALKTMTDQYPEVEDDL